jgi:hypothetical protein
MLPLPLIEGEGDTGDRVTKKKLTRPVIMNYPFQIIIKEFRYEITG